MEFGAADQKILDLLLMQGKGYERMDVTLQAKLEQVLAYIADATSVDDLKAFRSLNLKSFDGHYQVNIGGEKRMWFTVEDGEVIVSLFGSTDHRHERKR